MNSILPIIPFTKKACAEVRVPPSKSITNRALLLAAICGEPTLIKNPLRSRDAEIMLESLKRLGFSVIAQKNGGVEVSGSPRKEASLFVGNAGTAARFLTAYACAIEDGHFEFDSDAEMYARPMSGLIEALKEQGAQFEFLREENAFPFRVKTCGLKGGKIKLDASLSSQILSAVLMAAPLAKSDTQIELEGGTVSKPFVEMTLKMMSDFGFGAERTGGGSFLVRCGKAGVSPKEYEVESDATAASYPIMLAGVAGGAVLIKNYPKNSIQGDAKFAEFAESAGLARLARLGGDLLAIAPDAPAASCGGDFNDISDTFPTIAALVLVLAGLLAACFLIAKPLFYKMASTPFEFTKKLINRTPK
ncbi:MAG: hypothetical protein J6P03_00085, partial [Opitutales bacterium]|nr:hypothetical protein [Opitutales bacterium]